MEFLGYSSALLIGLTLGIMGAGGGILTVPILVYFFGITPQAAVRYALMIVGITSLISVVPRIIKGEVMIVHGTCFALMSIMVIVLCRSLLLPMIPDILYTEGSFLLSYASASMICFSLIMLIIARKMIIDVEHQQKLVEEHAFFKITVSAGLTGLFTAFLGAGGGFLIVPALTISLGLDMKKAAATSLYIISLNAISGFLSNRYTGHTDWKLIINTIALALLGSLIGGGISAKLDTGNLKRGFGWVTIGLATVILATELYQLSHPNRE